MKKKLFLPLLLLALTVVGVKAQNVARVGDTEYSTLAAAVANAPSGGTITMIADATENSYCDIRGNMTIDLNGKTITVKISNNYGTLWDILPNADLTIIDSSEGQSGRIVYGSNAINVILIAVDGKLTINSGTFTSSSSPSSACCIVSVKAGGTLIVNGGEFVSSLGRTTDTPGVISNKSVAKIYGGTIRNTSTGSDVSKRCINNLGTLYLIGGELASTGDAVWTSKSGTLVLGSGVSATGNITMASGNVSEYILSDDADFNTAAAVTANTVRYERGSSNTFGTVCLPFVPDEKATITYYKLREVSENTLTLEAVNTLTANTPYVYYTEDGTYNVSATNATIAANSAAGTQSTDGGWTLKGVYSRTNVSAEDEPNSYYIKENAFSKVNGNFNIKPFRAYFTAPGSTGSNRYEISIIDEATALRAFASDSQETVAIRSIDGTRLSKLQRGINLVTMSDGSTKKIIVK